MSRLVTWSLPQVITAALGWTVLVFALALLTPPGRFLVWLWRALQAGEQPSTTDFPVAALKAWFIVVPLLAFGPSAALMVSWLRAKGVRGGSSPT